MIAPRSKLFLSRIAALLGLALVGTACGGADPEESPRPAQILFFGADPGKALLQTDDSSPPRFFLFESVKDFAYHELRRSPHLEETLDRHTEFFLARGEDHAARMEGERALEAIRWLEAERENLVAIHQRSAQSRPDLAARAGLALAPVVLLEGYPPTDSHLVETTLTAARKSGDPKLLLRALDLRATAYGIHWRLDEALADAGEGISLARRLGDRVEEGRLLIRAALQQTKRGEFEEAIPSLERAIRIGEEEGEAFIRGRALMVRGLVALDRLELGEAEELLHQALEIFRTHGFVRSRGIASANAGLLWSMQGRFREGRRAMLEALEAGRQTGDHSFEAISLLNLGCLHRYEGLLDEAEDYLQQALTLRRSLGNRFGEGDILGQLGILALERDDLELAERYLSESEGILLEHGVEAEHAKLLCFIAVVEARQGRLDRARRSLGRARSYLDDLDDPSGAAAEFSEGLIEMALARSVAETDPLRATQIVEGVRRRLGAAAPRTPESTGNLATLRRLLERDLERWPSELREAELETAASEGLRVGPNAAWFQLPDAPRVSLGRRLPLRRIFEALVEKRLAAPGIGLDANELFELGWPAVRLPHEIAMRRVYVGIWTLRKLGLSEVLLHQTDGYLIDPNQPVRWQEG